MPLTSTRSTSQGYFCEIKKNLASNRVHGKLVIGIVLPKNDLQNSSPLTPVIFYFIIRQHVSLQYRIKSLYEAKYNRGIFM